MPWLALRALPWRYIGAGLAILALALLIWRAPWAEHRQKAKDAVIIARITQDRDTHASNERILQAALDRQNAAVGALKAEGDKRVSDGKAALAQVKKANAGLTDQAEALRKSSSMKPATGAPCIVSDTLAKVGSI